MSNFNFIKISDKFITEAIDEGIEKIDININDINDNNNIDTKLKEVYIYKKLNKSKYAYEKDEYKECGCVYCPYHKKTFNKLRIKN